MLETLRGRSLLTWLDYSTEEIQSLLDLSRQVKAESASGGVFSRFRGKTLALLFEKRSTRTRCAFETAFGEEGGHPVFLSTADIQLGAKESVEDTARVLGRMFSAVQYRGFKQETLEILAEYAGVPVYNGLTDRFHPTQVLADILTLEENFGPAKGRKLCYVGDGRNNVARSLMVICAKLGIHLVISSPLELFPDDTFTKDCDRMAQAAGGSINVAGAVSAAAGADAVYTDVWTSMGEEERREERRKLLAPFQVNQEVMRKTGRQDAIFLHCLPAVKGEEVSAEVIEGKQSRVWDQAENRKHTIKAILLATLGQSALPPARH
jgi:ornithine carbamoyltransferase